MVDFKKGDKVQYRNLTGIVESTRTDEIGVSGKITYVKIVLDTPINANIKTISPRAEEVTLIEASPDTESIDTEVNAAMMPGQEYTRIEGESADDYTLQTVFYRVRSQIFAKLRDAVGFAGEDLCVASLFEHYTFVVGTIPHYVHAIHVKNGIIRTDETYTGYTSLMTRAKHQELYPSSNPDNYFVADKR